MGCSENKQTQDDKASREEYTILFLVPGDSTQRLIWMSLLEMVEIMGTCRSPVTGDGRSSTLLVQIPLNISSKMWSIPKQTATV